LALTGEPHKISLILKHSKSPAVSLTQRSETVSIFNFEKAATAERTKEMKFRF
jgi:hypothetical protein